MPNITEPLQVELPVRPGETQPRIGYYNPYSGRYTESRSYGQRMQRGYLRGLSQTEARRNAGQVPRYSEYERRVSQAQAAGYQSPYQRFTLSFERRYGFSYSYWRKLYRNWISEINSMASPGAMITPAFVAEELRNEKILGQVFIISPAERQQTIMGPVMQPDNLQQENLSASGKAWIERRLDEKLYAMRQYREGNSEPGAAWFHARDNFRAIEWWWYH